MYLLKKTIISMILFLCMASLILAADYEVQYKCGDTNLSTINIKPQFIIKNNTTLTVAASSFKIRYYYTAEGTALQMFTCDYALLGSANVTSVFADGYMELGFAASAPVIAANGNSGEIQCRVNKSDWSNYDQSNDYSFLASMTSFGSNTKVALFLNGTLVYGTLQGTPTGTGIVQTRTPVTTSTATAGRTPTATRTSTTTRTPTTARTRTQTGRTATRTPSSTATRTASATPTATGDVPVANPFVGVKWYVNPEWSANAATSGGSAIANCSTAVWLDSLASVTGGPGISQTLAGHMDAALSQGANLITLVIYNIPNRDCASYTSYTAEIGGETGLNDYKTLYIDPIASIISNSKYSSLRIITIIEPDTLANMITNLSLAACAEVNNTGVYVAAIQYALNKFSTINNVYNYVDASNAAIMGYDSNFTPLVTLLSNTIKNTTYGINSVKGFVTNTANYIATEEIFLPDPTLVAGSGQIYSSAFFDWNKVFDGLDYTTDLYNALVTNGFSSSIGMLIDTSRNGWGGPARPAAISTSTDLNTYVNESRIDRRSNRFNWCNQETAGLGARPQASPASKIHAFVWIKPPGESDGISTAGITDPYNPYKEFDRMCDPAGINYYCMCGTTDAMPYSPHVGLWSPALFTILLQNAYPPVL